LKGTFGKEAYIHVPIALLQSIGDLERDFDIKGIEDDTLELIPKRHMGVIKKILLVIAPGEFPIKRFTIFDLYANSVTIEIDEVDINTNLDDLLFSFKIPPDVEVFDLNQ